MKTLIVGMNNLDPRFDLYPVPKGCTGWHLWKMLHDRTGASKVEYVRTFDRKNIVYGRRWDRRSARKFSASPGSTVILPGEEVRRAVSEQIGSEISKLIIHPQVFGNVTYRYVPHPSGWNRFYNDPIQRELIAMLLQDCYDEE
jgi:hypothetical protein